MCFRHRLGNCSLDGNPCELCEQFITANPDVFEEIHSALDALHKKTHRASLTTFRDIAASRPGCLREHHEAFVAIQQRLTITRAEKQKPDLEPPERNWF